MCSADMRDNDITYTLRLGMKREKSFWGPGVAQLLHQIECCHSLRAAAQCMGISYSKAWKIIHDAEQGLGFALVESISGGVCGGGSHLTEKGSDILSAYDKTVSTVEKVLMKVFEQNIRVILDNSITT